MSRMLTTAVEGAYHSLLLAGRHPIAVVNIQINPTLLDVNVHPAKTEIRFLKERRVFAAILNATRQSILEEPEMPQWQPVQQQTNSTSTATSTNASSSSDILDEDIFTSDDTKQDNKAAAIATSSDETIQSLPLDSPWITVAEEETGTKPPMISRLWQSHVRSSTTNQDTQAHTSHPLTVLPSTLQSGISHTEQTHDPVQSP